MSLDLHRNMSVAEPLQLINDVKRLRHQKDHVSNTFVRLRLTSIGTTSRFT